MRLMIGCSQYLKVHKTNPVWAGEDGPLMAAEPESRSKLCVTVKSEEGKAPLSVVSKRHLLKTG